MQVDHTARVPKAVAQGRIRKAQRRRRVVQAGQRPGSKAVVVSVSNLAPSVTSQDIADLFNSVGPTITAFIRHDREGKSKGVATVKYADMETAERAVKQFHSLTLDGQPLVVQIESSGAAAALNTSGAHPQTQRSAVPPSMTPKRKLRLKERGARLPPVPKPTAEAVGGLRIVAGKGGVRDVVRVLESTQTMERRRARRRRRLRMQAAGDGQQMETESTATPGFESEKHDSTAKRTTKARGRRRMRRPTRPRGQEAPSKSAEELDRELEEYRMADN
ncbi:unknown transcriptional coactivator [Cyanidioschyzon merolae strain 10D]|jgi:RNA recognition motif-containing protein|uniref:RRM domain-containing protein n=1 Tax=Cyanidioschyzon merolae (strain NIES-3377 / 10D) TaxID=280699 RepID=M1VBQ9_CYAM1|nr:unknown transcriptional coactivator [Cyanidioschyzon merolae strain 10D]BAM79807.1 unknown transcriptional coactivator [Cyanidioschyzon merolae strain 10D]|eukprot:XP_005536093.1 unknown transcriptional coactivator [Cyanidioschyzon merolae strain 10D]